MIEADHDRDNVFEITREFDAPRELVWKAWTEPARLAEWMGPKGSSKGRVLRHELRPGGVLHSSYDFNGQEMWGKSVYREVVPVSRLVWVQSFSDEQGTLARHPMAPAWPLEMLTTVLLEDLDQRTRLTLRWEPINATDEERKIFRDAKLSMQGGWTGSFDALAEHLAKAK
jgi:uncharacterized protein YndB with AHSA1/START domain